MSIHIHDLVISVGASLEPEGAHEGRHLMIVIVMLIVIVILLVIVMLIVLVMLIVIVI